jgi:hypothetical protein
MELTGLAQHNDVASWELPSCCVHGLGSCTVCGVELRNRCCSHPGAPYLVAWGWPVRLAMLFS